MLSCVFQMVVQLTMAAPAFQLFPDQWDMDSIIGKNCRESAQPIISKVKICFRSESKSPCLEHVIVHYRFIFVMFLLPVSFLYDIWFYTRNKIVFAMSSAPTKHKEKVLGIQRQVRSCLRDKGWMHFTCYGQQCSDKNQGKRACNSKISGKMYI